jgi:aspartyl-tRNA(Asn)/glutamyl-tRNA(Gln) amidotransferase subunit A
VTDPLNAVITWVDPEPARPGPLAGKRLLVKDLVDTAGVRTTYGSRIYSEHVPERTAPAVTCLVEAGAVLIGKANLPEFAWNVTGQNPWYGTVRNPVRPGLTTGGSSSGNAAALAGGLCDLGLGSDTGCSIRLPSSCCDVVGLKTRWGSVPVEGVHPLCPTLDTVGPMATTVQDAASCWSALTGRPVPEPRLEGLAVGLLTRPPSVGDGNRAPASGVAEVWVDRLEALGSRVRAVEVPEPQANTWPLFFHEAAESHRATFPARADEYSENVRTKLELARSYGGDEVAAAYRAVERWRRYEPEVDLYVSPCVAIELPPEDCDELEVRLPLTAWLRWVNLIGWAALAIGNLQLIAPRDETVLAAGLAWERGDGSGQAPGSDPVTSSGPVPDPVTSSGPVPNGGGAESS